MVIGKKETLKRTKTSVWAQLHKNYLICMYKQASKIHVELLEF